MIGLGLHWPHADPGTFGGADYAYAPGPHGAEQIGVDARRRAGQVLEHLPVVVAEAVAANGDVEVVPGHERACAVQLRRDQFERAFGIALAAVKYLQGTAGVQRIEVFELLVLKFWRAHQKAGTGRVDEAAAIEGNAIGVGQDVVGRAPEDLLRAFDQRGVAADHFVEDGRRCLALELRVGGERTGQLRLAGVQGVVQHHPGAGDVVVEKLVVRQATGVGRDDIDHRDAVVMVDDWYATGARGGFQPTLGQGGGRTEQGEEDGPAQGIGVDRR